MPDADALSQMAQVLAHRLRGLIASIEGFTDLLVDTLNSRDQRELAFKILEGAARVESILADLQLYSDQPSPVFMPVPVDELLNSLAAAVASDDLDRIQTDVNGSAGIWKLDADPYLARQALLVLVQNALEATPPNEPIRIHVAPDADSSSVRFSVWNDGVIGAEYAEAIVFDPFYTTKAQNLGVGLAIAKRIADLHGGSLRLTTNSVEDGVAFSLVLPMLE